MQPTRFACDRCRGQKLRCLREKGFYQPCKRCQKAGVACLASPPTPMGRARRASNNYPLRHETQDMEVHSPLSATMRVDNEELFPMLAEDSFAPREGLLPHPVDTAFGNVSDVDLPINSLEYWSYCNPPNPSRSSGVQSSDFLLQERSSVLKSRPSDGQRLQHTFPTPSPSCISDYMPNYSTRGGHNDQSNCRENQDRRIPEESLRQGILETAAVAGNSDSGSSCQRIASIQSHVLRETEMKPLLELTQSLYVQQKAFEAAPWARCLSSLSLTAGPKHSDLSPEEAGASKPIGDILRSSEMFLKIITRFLAPAQNSSQPLHSRRTPDTCACPNVSTKNIEVGEISQACNLQSNHTSLPADGTYFQQPSPSPSLRPLNHPTSSSMTPPTLDHIDTATSLLILTCYIRLLCIYTTLFSHMNEYLSTLSSSAQSDSHTASSNPESLHMDGFSLHSCGEIQLKILVDISIHLITSIEKTLGRKSDV